MPQPVAVAAQLNYTHDQAKQLSKPHQSTRDVRPLLRQYHDELVVTLAPQLNTMREDGLIVDHATSWLLGEFVAHVAADRVAEAETRLSACAELKNVRRAELTRRRGKNR